MTTRRITKTKTDAGGARSKLRAASYSALHEYEKGCPRRVFYARVERRPDPLGPAAQRGNRIHEATYKHLVQNQDFPREMEKMRKHLTQLKGDIYELECEGDWAVNRNWDPTEWLADDVYIRCKTDVLALAGDKTRTIDFKTGREYEHHVEQMELQALFTFIRNEHVNALTCELWYVDQGEISSFKVKRKEVDDLKSKFVPRVDKLLEETAWPERPGQGCKWCPFSRAKGGPCRY